MKKSLGIICILIIVFSLSACGKSSFDGSRTGNDSQFVMEYKIFNTTDGQSLLLESGDMIRAEVVVDGGKLSIKIQKDSDTPIYESENIVTSENFDVEVQESGTYKITVTGEEAKGSVSFEKVAGEKDAQKEVQQEVNERTIDLSEAFQSVNGCVVIYSPAQEQYSFFNEEMCRQEESPYSTFKIVSALSGLQNGVIVDESSTMGYDGTDYGNLEWNGDLTLKEAFQKSCIWYFREVIDSVGKSELQEEINNLQYGNCDISEWDGSNINPMKNLNGFWLDSSLKISPLEQVKVLEKIFEGQSNYDSSNVEILKSIMLLDESDTQKIYGKTGTGANGEAWFVGFSELSGERKYFAIYLEDSTQREQISGEKAKEIALQIMK
ncbi:hypothetical protein GCM10008910_13810 [Faecalicatena orotica]|uniref:Beta-lactamase n=1 Tax=Faecalicatena orotica TaxID=1544 RepID=A0A2Y9BEA3_9FIRM|nr:penicillin-binding transpeptidase domain-containing protein [Faecalicatena orotica]PWJ31425.1 bla regulator protein BlaR1 [Faecalicatena orotica]SSA54631.1 bla regulator protein blaR1 [Faecalicatena orotica]